MRDVNRIDKYVNQIKDIWKKFPDWRFGQLLMNICSMIEDNPAYFFYIEDDELFKKIEESANQLRGKNNEDNGLC